MCQLQSEENVLEEKWSMTENAADKANEMKPGMNNMGS